MALMDLTPAYPRLTPWVSFWRSLRELVEAVYLSG